MVVAIHGILHGDTKASKQWPDWNRTKIVYHVYYTCAMSVS